MANAEEIQNLDKYEFEQPTFRNRTVRNIGFILSFLTRSHS